MAPTVKKFISYFRGLPSLPQHFGDKLGEFVHSVSHSPEGFSSVSVGVCYFSLDVGGYLSSQEFLALRPQLDFQ